MEAAAEALEVERVVTKEATAEARPARSVAPTSTLSCTELPWGSAVATSTKAKCASAISSACLRRGV